MVQFPSNYRLFENKKGHVTLTTPFLEISSYGWYSSSSVPLTYSPTCVPNRKCIAFRGENGAPKLKKSRDWPRSILGTVLSSVLVTSVRWDLLLSTTIFEVYVFIFTGSKDGKATQNLQIMVTESIVRGHSRSLEMVSFDRLHSASC